jgi:hypothetical protein
MWKDFKTRFDGILSSLKRHKAVIDSRATLAHYRDYRDDMQKYRDDMGKLNKKLDDRIADEEKKKLKAVSNWLAEGQQQQTDHETFSHTRRASPGTAQWIFKNEFVKEWLESSRPGNPLVWITGIPGAGAYRVCSQVYPVLLIQSRQNCPCFGDHRYVYAQT